MFCVRNIQHIANVVYKGNSLCLDCFKAELKQDGQDIYKFNETPEQFQQRMRDEKSLQVAPRR
jgi:hypothetical protein